MPPQGPLEYHIDPQPLKIVQTPRQIFIIYESNYGLARSTWTASPAAGGAAAELARVLVGRWEGDTLVVESNNFHGVDPNNLRSVGLPAGFLGVVGWLDHRGTRIQRQ